MRTFFNRAAVVSLGNRLLARAETVFKTDINYFISGNFWGIVGQVAASAASLLLAIVISHVLSKGIYGNYKYVLAIVSTLGIFSLNNFGVPILRAAAQGYNGTLMRAFWDNIRWSAAIWLGGLAVALYYAAQGNLLLAAGIAIGALCSPIIASGNLYLPFLAGKKDFRRAAIYTSVFGATIPAAVLALAAVLTHSAWWLIVAYFVSSALIALYFFRRTIAAYHAAQGTVDPGMLSYAKHLSFIGIIGGIAGNIDQLLAFHFVGAAGLAEYSFAVAIVDQSKGPLKNLDAMVQARFAARVDADVAAGMKNKLLWLFALSLLAVIVYIAAAPLIYNVLFPRYHDVVAYSQVYAVSLLATVFGPVGSYLAAKRKVKEQYWNSLVFSALQIVGLIVGVLFWGLWGLIIARVFCRIAGGAFTFVLYRSSVKKEIMQSSQDPG